MFSNTWGEIGDQIFKITPILAQLFTKQKTTKCLISLAYNIIQYTSQNMLCNPHNPKVSQKKLILTSPSKIIRQIKKILFKKQTYNAIIIKNN